MQGGLQLASNTITGANDQCALSENGETQVREVHDLLVKNRDQYFGEQVYKAVDENNLIVAHSPLLRAKQTCEGLITPEIFNGRTVKQKWYELDSLTEILPVEKLDYRKRHFAATRIGEFEHWLHARDEEYVIVVGHSHYFRQMVGVPYKFSNCEVWKTTFLGEAMGNQSPLARWTNLQRLCGSTTAKSTFGAEGPTAW